MQTEMIRKREMIDAARHELLLAYVKGHWRPKQLHRPERPCAKTRWMGMTSGLKSARYSASASQAFGAEAAGRSSSLTFAPPTRTGVRMNPRGYPVHLLSEEGVILYAGVSDR